MGSISCSYFKRKNNGIIRLIREYLKIVIIIFTTGNIAGIQGLSAKIAMIALGLIRSRKSLRLMKS